MQANAHETQADKLQTAQLSNGGLRLPAASRWALATIAGDKKPDSIPISIRIVALIGWAIYNSYNSNQQA